MQKLVKERERGMEDIMRDVSAETSEGERRRRGGGGGGMGRILCGT